MRLLSTQTDFDPYYDEHLFRISVNTISKLCMLRTMVVTIISFYFILFFLKILWWQFVVLSYNHPYIQFLFEIPIISGQNITLVNVPHAKMSQTLLISLMFVQ